YPGGSYGYPGGSYGQGSAQRSPNAWGPRASRGRRDGRLDAPRLERAGADWSTTESSDPWRPLRGFDRDERSQSYAGMGRYYGKGPKGYVRSDDRIRDDVCDRLSDDDDVDASE